MNLRSGLCCVLIAFLLFPFFAHSQITPPTQEFSLRFNGSQIATAPTNSLLNLGSEFTMSTWVYLESWNQYDVIMGKPNDPRGSDPYMNYVLEISPDGKYEFIQSTGQPGSYTSVKSNSAVVLKKWTHVAGVLSNGKMKLFIDGIVIDSTTSPGQPAAAGTIPFSIGAGASPDGSISAAGIKGALRQAQVWSRALTANEIVTYASATLTGNENGLIVCWPLDDGSGTQARAVSSNNNLSLTLGNSSGQLVPDWIRNEVLLNLEKYFKPHNFTLPSSSSLIQDGISFDYDSDGDRDLIITNLVYPATYPGTETPIIVMKNDGTGVFSQVSDSWVDSIKFVHPRHWTIADFDKDGKDELVIVDHGTDISPFPGGQSKFLDRSSQGSLVDETSNKFPTVSAFTHNVASADIDNDGDMDIYMCNIQGTGTPSPRLYINDGNGVFTASESQLPSVITTFTKKYMSCAFADIDKDGDQDLILGGHDGSGSNENFPTDAILLNDGHGNFSFAADASLPDRATGAGGGTVAIATADFNNDGWPDLLMSTLFEYRIAKLQLLLNNKNGTFSDASDRIPQSWPTAANYGNSWIRWIFPADFNNDGLMDFLAVGQNECPSKLFINNGNNFIDISEYVLFGSGVQACAVDDFNKDGRIDILVLRNDRTATLLTNESDYTVSSLKTVQVQTPLGFKLEEPFPNPFNPSTNINFSIRKSGKAVIQVFDILGRLVSTVFDDYVNDGVVYQVQFNASEKASGTYFVRLESAGQSITKKIVLIK